MVEPLNIDSYTKPLQEGDRKFFSMSNILLHVVRTFISTDIEPELHFLEERVGAEQDEVVRNLRTATDKLTLFCHLIGALSMMARGYDVKEVRESLLRTAFFSPMPSEDDFYAVLDASRVGLGLPMSSSLSMNKSIDRDMPLASLYGYEGIYPTRLFYQILLTNALLEFYQYGYYEDGCVTLDITIRENGVLLSTKGKESFPERRVSADDQLFLFHLLLNFLGMGAVILEADDGLMSLSLKLNQK